MCDATPEATVTLPSSVLAPSLARDFVERHICPHHGDTAEGAVKLVTSELVTNAVLYGEPPVSIRLACAEREIRVEVADGNDQKPVISGSHEGLGLLLVRKVANDWGTLGTTSGKIVWCAVPTGILPLPVPRAGTGDRARPYYRSR
jgi:hypothetical protein